MQPAPLLLPLLWLSSCASPPADPAAAPAAAAVCWLAHGVGFLPLQPACASLRRSALSHHSRACWVCCVCRCNQAWCQRYRGRNCCPMRAPNCLQRQTRRQRQNAVSVTSAGTDMLNVLPAACSVQAAGTTAGSAGKVRVRHMAWQVLQASCKHAAGDTGCRNQSPSPTAR